MISLLRADLLKTRKRWMGWVMLAVSMTLVGLLMAVVMSFDPALREQAAPDFGYPSGLLAGPQVLSQFGTLMVMVFGASLVGTEYRFDTWKNLLTRRASRVPFVASKWLTLVISVLVGAALLALFSQGLGLLLKPAEIPAASVGLGTVLAGIGVYMQGWVIAGTIGMLGAVLGRSTVGGIILGIAWTIGESIVGSVAMFNARLEWITEGLSSTAINSLLAHINDTPAQLSVLHSSVVLVIYMIVPLVLAAVIFRKRDMAG